MEWQIADVEQVQTEKSGKHIVHWSEKMEAKIKTT